MQSIDVNLDECSYRVTIEPGLCARLGELVRPHHGSGPVLLAVDSEIADTHGRTARSALDAAGVESVVHTVVADETSKTLDAVRAIYDTMLEASLDRSSLVVALGGGIVGDTAGFAAATYYRGLPVVQVPSTLLAMVDASIGGKTGVNHPLPGGRGLGKNLIGSFWQPRAVLIDPQLLQTLDDRHLRSGLAECVKHGMVADAGLLDHLERDHHGLLERSPEHLTACIHRSAAVKCNIVQTDVREHGRRALLNLGHTFAHAIEPIESLRLHHGEAVAVGLTAAAHCAVRTGRLASDQAARVDGLLRTLQLPTELRHPVQVDELMTRMRYDKKVADGRQRLVLPVGLGRAEVVDDCPAATVREAWLAVGAEA